jgi:hypothetical protein
MTPVWQIHLKQKSGPCRLRSHALFFIVFILGKNRNLFIHILLLWPDIFIGYCFKVFSLAC